MFRGIAIFTICILAGFPCAWGFEDSPRDRYFSGHRSPDDQALIHGYYPKEFSENFPDYWVTSEEAGHYIMGHSDYRDRYYPTYTTTTVSATSPGDPIRVLISGARTTVIKEIENIQPTSSNNRPTQVNDSRNLQRVIDEHRWVLPAFIRDQL